MMNKTARSVAITGAAGRVGRLVAEDLVNDGMVVKIMDLPGVNYEGLEGQPGYEILPGDIGDRAQPGDYGTPSKLLCPPY